MFDLVVLDSKWNARQAMALDEYKRSTINADTKILILIITITTSTNVLLTMLLLPLLI